MEFHPDSLTWAMAFPLSIRPATSADTVSIAALHATSWKSAYKNILPQEYLDNDLESERKQYWFAKMQGLTVDDFILLVEKDNTLIGFVAVLDRPEKGYAALIDNLHVLPEEKSNKIGIYLLCSAARELKKRKKDSFYLWVFDQNTPAINFYHKAGGRPLDHNLFEINDRKIPETRYVWESVDRLNNLFDSLVIA